MQLYRRGLVRRIIRYRDFGVVRPRIAWEIRRGRVGGRFMKVMVVWLREPNQDFAAVVEQGPVSAADRGALLDLSRELGVLDIRTRRFYWPRKDLDRKFRPL